EMESILAQGLRDQVEGEKVPGEIQEIALIVSVPDSGENVLDHDLPVLHPKASRTADPDVQIDVLQERRDDHSFLDEGLDDEKARLPAEAAASLSGNFRVPSQERVPHEESAVGPGGLRQVFDRLRYPLITVDQNHVRRGNRGLQFLRIVEDETLVMTPRLSDQVNEPLGQQTARRAHALIVTSFASTRRRAGWPATAVATIG